MTPLSATVEPVPGDEESTVTLRIANDSDSGVEVLNPDMGQPSPQMNWPHSIATYRASLLMSYGFLTVSVSDESGDEAARTPIETWATPVLRADVPLAPGESIEVAIPLARFFALADDRSYRVAAEYGRDPAKVRGEGTLGG